MAYEQDYQYICDCIENANQEFMASESHGCACGVLCGHQDSALNVWLESQLSPPVEVGSEQLELLTSKLVELFNSTEQKLVNTDFEFMLFLPDDEDLLRARLEALGEWCSGFLLGLSLVGIDDIQSMNENCREFIADILEIARVGSTELGDENVDETAYMELLEYVRLGVISVYEDMFSTQDPQILH